MSSVAKIIQRARMEGSSLPRADKETTPTRFTSPEIPRVVLGWIAASRRRHQARAGWRSAGKQSRTHKNLSFAQKLTAKIIVSTLILTACLGGYEFAFGAPSSEGRDDPKDAAASSAGKWKATEQYFVTIESLRVHYIESGTGRTVVMIHGNAGGVEDFEFGVVELLSRDYRVIAVDRPGHGKSDRPARKAETVEYQAQLLHQTLSHLGITEPVIVGHSWGAALALAYALKYPGEVSAMVLLAPAAYADHGWNGLLRTATKTPVVGDLSLLLGKLFVGRRMLKQVLTQAFFPQAVPDSYLKLVSASWLRRKQLKAYLEDELALNDSLKKLSKRYSEIDIPVIIVTGDQDKIVSPKENAYRLQAAIPQSQLIELKDTGHEIPQTHPESVYAALKLISSSAASMSAQSIKSPKYPSE